LQIKILKQLPFKIYLEGIIDMPKEAKARIRINKLLEEAGWRFF